MKVGKSVPGVVQAAHRIPYPKREKLKSTLEKQWVVPDVDSVVRSAGTSGGPTRKKKCLLPARPDADSSLEESTLTQ